MAGANDRPKSKGMKDIRAHDDSHSDEEGQDQSFYAGGEKSGIAVMGGGGGNPNRPDRDRLDDQARQLIEAASTDTFEAEESGHTSSLRVFAGRPRRLGDDNDEEANATEQSADAQKPVSRVLTLWQDGFSLDDGPLHEYTEPANREIMRQLMSRQIPHEFLNVAPGAPVDLKIEQRLEESFSQSSSRQSTRAFTGSHRRLGDTASTAAAGNTSTSTVGTGPLQLEGFDEKKTNGSVQVRLPDGSRRVVRVNSDLHTLAQLRSFIFQNLLSDTSADSVDLLLMGRPPRKLTAEENVQSLADLSIVNNVVIVQN